MARRKPKALTNVKIAARPARTSRGRTVVPKRTKRGKPVRKLFNDPRLFGALPGLAKWALPLLKELRDDRCGPFAS